MAQRVIQSSFSFGELDPKLFARSDFQGFYKGARKARNVIAVAQGALVKRFGTKFIAMMRDVTANANIATKDKVRLFAFNRIASGIFIIIMRANNATESAFDIYNSSGSLISTVSAGVTYTINMIKEVKFVAFADRIFILHKSVAPRQLVNANPATPGMWALSAVPFNHVPTFDFSFKDGLSYSTPGVTFTPSATSGSAVTLTCVGATPFTSNHVGGLFIGGGGILRITAVSSATVAAGYTVDDFVGVAAIRGDLAVLTEKAWSDANPAAPEGKARGWPSVGRIYQDRLVLANTGTVGHVVWFSGQNQYLDFNESEADATDSFALGIPDNDTVEQLCDKNSLVAFGKRANYSTLPMIGEPLSPNNAFFAREDSTGSNGVPPALLDDQLFFADSQGRQINLMANKADVLSGSGFQIANASIFSPTLINKPISMAAFQSPTSNGQLLLVVNEDGTMATLQSEARQDVAAWTLAQTRGAFAEVASVDERAFVLVERDIRSNTIAGDPNITYNVTDNFSTFSDGATSLMLNQNDYLLIGHACPFDSVALNFTTAASLTINPTFEYLDQNNQWSVLLATDGTAGFTVNGNLTWTAHSIDWSPQLVNGLELFWVRIKRRAASIATAPLINTLKLNVERCVLLEELNFDTYLDATTDAVTDAEGLVTGLTHLAGQNIFVMEDGVPNGQYIVEGNGHVQTNIVSADIKVGVFFAPLVVPMPIAVVDPRNPNAADLYKPRLIKSVFVDYYESLGILIDDVEAASFDLATLTAGKVLAAQTDVKEISPRTGFDPRAAITITQKAPLPFSIRGVGFVVEVG